MNSMIEQRINDINIKQNEENIKLLLFSQKFIYEEVKNLKYITWGLAIISLLSGIFLNEYLIIKVIVGGGVFFISLFLDNWIKKKGELAAATQEVADRTLYGFSIESSDLNGIKEEQIYEEAKNRKDLDERKYMLIINNSGTDTPPGVKDWYDDINDNIPKLEAILKCQKQNIYWDKSLIGIYRKFLYVCIFVLIIIGIALSWNRAIKDIVSTLITGLPILKIIIYEVFNSHKYINYSKEVDASISSIKDGDSINIKQLKNLQIKIYERRKSGFNVPDYFHHKYTKLLHKKYKNSNL